MTSPNEFNRKALLQQVLDQFKLNRDGYHGRVGTKPHKDYLSPQGAKLIEKAYRRSLQKKESELAIEDLLD
jgi:hypothetical protein